MLQEQQDAEPTEARVQQDAAQKAQREQQEPQDAELRGEQDEAPPEERDAEPWEVREVCS